jgi:hypothetical protein
MKVKLCCSWLINKYSIQVGNEAEEIVQTMVEVINLKKKWKQNHFI